MDSSLNPSNLRWIVGQEGSRETYAVPVGFQRVKALRAFYADIWCRWGRGVLRYGPTGMRSLATRFHSEIPQDRVVSFNFSAIRTKSIQHFRRWNEPPATQGEAWCRYGRWFALQVRDQLEKIELDSNRDAYFGYDTNSLEALEWLAARGLFTVLDQADPGKMHEDLVIEEVQRWPSWQKFPGRLPQSYWDRRQAEWRVASVVMVNSEWSRQALIRQGVALEKIIVVPLAIDLSNKDLSHPVQPQAVLRVLWLGNVILSKGIQYLVEAARILRSRNIQFLLAGPLGISDQAVRSFPDNIMILGRVTRDQLGETYRRAHIFVLPTISDGFAITQLEAMAHGLPVITTPNCGRVVTHGVNGFLIPARDGKALADVLARLSDDRPLVRELSANALITIQEYDLPSNARLINREVERIRASKLQQATVQTQSGN
jgi:glycosyltransferase involved in cell wall biosynthesis